MSVLHLNELSEHSFSSCFVVGCCCCVWGVFFGGWGPSDTVLYKLSRILDVRNRILKCIWFGPVYMYRSDCLSSDQCRVPV